MRISSSCPARLPASAKPEEKIVTARTPRRTQASSASFTPAAGSAPYQVQASWSVGADTCVGGSQIAPTGASTGSLAGIVFAYDSAVFRDADGVALVFDPATRIVPLGAVSVENIGVTASWDDSGWGLAPASTTFGGACTSAPAPPAP